MTDRKRAGEPLDHTTSKKLCFRLTVSEARDLNATMNNVGYVKKNPDFRHTSSPIIADVLWNFIKYVSSTSLKGHVPPNIVDTSEAYDFYEGLSKDQKWDLACAIEKARENHEWIAFAEEFCDVKVIVSNELEAGPPPKEIAAQERATMAGWERVYVGEMAEELWKHIGFCLEPHYKDEKYANLCPIIQSSGTGKSRTVDELSTKHFVIPLCLRMPNTTGFPPADHRVRNYLTRKTMGDESFRLVDAFLSALFQVTAEKLRDLYNCEHMDYTALAADFRQRMTKGQTIKNTNQFRTDFYDRVIDCAEKMLASEKTSKALGKAKETMHELMEVEETATKQGLANSPAEVVTDSSGKNGAEQSFDSSQDTGENQSKTVALNDTPTRKTTRKSRSYTAFFELERVLTQITAGVAEVSSPTQKSKRKKGSSEKTKVITHPLVIIAFDEAGALTEIKDDKKPIFDALRQKLRALNDCSLFSLFLSTTGQISAFVSPSGMPDSSLRLIKRILKLNSPFTGCEFDLFAKKGKDGTEGDDLFDLTLSDVTSEWYMAHLGRALWASRLYNTNHKEVDDSELSLLKRDIVLFAAAKLLNDAHFANLDDIKFSNEQTFACLSQRLPLEFNSTTYFSREQQRDQVENHMRICLQVDPTFERMVTLSSSEPLLSEAAFAIMQNKGFDAEDALMNVMTGFSVHKGDRGEHLALLLLIKARDAVVRSKNPDAMWRNMKIIGNPVNREWQEWNRVVSVPEFIESLFKGLPSTILKGIKKDFAKAKLHVNHFLKVHEHKLVRREFLLRLFSRGAGVLCANCQEAIDAIMAYLIDDHLHKKALGAILYQMKNNPEYASLTPDWSLFDKMEQVKLGLYDTDEEPLPTIRIIFNTAGKPTLRARRVKVKYGNGKTYVAYDIWCGGLSSKYLGPIAKGKEDKWTALLDASCPWDNYYKLKGRTGMQSYLQKMNPGAASSSAFWTNFFPLEQDHGRAAGRKATAKSGSAHGAEEAGEEKDSDAYIDPEVAKRLIAQLDANV